MRQDSEEGAMAHSLILVLMLLLFSSPAGAQDVPPLVLIDVDLHWTVPVYGSVGLSGREEWQNGVGYTDNTKSQSDRWHPTGLPCLTCPWVNEPALNPAFAGQFVLDLESAQPQGIPHFIVPLDGQFQSPVVRPGNYTIGGAEFVDPGIGGCCPPPTFFADSGHITVLAVPEQKILRRLMPKHIYGRELAAIANPRLQPLTAWGATMILRALHISAIQQGALITLPSVTLEVQEWCSGLVSMKWLLLLAVGFSLVAPVGLPWKIALVLAAPLIALEVNILRVAGIGAYLEVFGHASRHAVKEWAGWGATVFGAVQVVALGRLINGCRRRRAREAERE